MEIQQLRWWHWSLISLAVGWLLALVNAGPIDSLGMRDQDEAQFEQAVLTSPMGDNHLPFCKDLIVYPSVSAQGPGGHAVQVMPVTYQALTPVGSEGEYAYRLYWFCARVPYLPAAVRAAISPHYPAPPRAAGDLQPGMIKAYVPSPTDTLESIARSVYGSATAQNQEALSVANHIFEFSHSIAELMASGRLRPGRPIMIPPDPTTQPRTVRDWINDAKASYPWVEYRFAWWRAPLNENLVWVGSSFVLIGVIWPILLRLLAGAGLAGAHLAAEDYDLGRFATARTKSKPKDAAASGGLSEGAAGQLAALTDAMSASIKQGAGSAGAGEKPPAAQNPVASQWKPAPADAAQPPVPAVEEQKEFSGEFYPVAHPAEQTKDQKSEKGSPRPL